MGQRRETNDLREYFLNNKSRPISKWMHYFEIYDRHFSRFRGTAVNVVEIGVWKGGSLQMWKHYFGPKARIVGIDIDPSCKRLEEPQIEILIGSQEDRGFLRSVVDSLPRIDILIDDGGHMMSQQIVTFEDLFPHVDERGVYLCEDLHTSYWKQFGGGYKCEESFVEYSKNFIDFINAWHSSDPDRLPVSNFTKSAHSLHYYDSMLVIEKRPIEKPESRITGVG